jgi:hypothetical protein
MRGRKRGEEARGGKKKGERKLGREWPTREKEGGRGAGPRRLGPGKRERERFGADRLLSSSPFLIFSTLQLLKQIHWNSNKFEFKPYKLNTRKIMFQHECTNMLLL